jgi:hypothetical protein
MLDMSGGAKITVTMDSDVIAIEGAHLQVRR